MSKLIGTNPNQVPSNADLGSAAFMDKKEFILSEGSTLSAIDAELFGTATDVFVYDTSKDSDGGAWRKNTQNKSWYKEPLNTSTRGSRREFPKIAVIVAEASSVTIYDGDDPNLPMWMIFSTTSGSILRSGQITSVVMMNAEMWVGHNSGSGLHWVNFIKDTARWLTGSASYGGYFAKGTIDKRNRSGANYLNNIGGASDITIVNSDCLDLAITVLPNAPIDGKTGLPTPTVGVATNGGVSVIKDNGAVVDISITSAQTSSNSITFLPDNRIAFNAQQSSVSTSFYRYCVAPIPSSDVNTQAYWQSYSDDVVKDYAYSDYNGEIPLFTNAGLGGNVTDVSPFGKDHAIAGLQSVSLLSEGNLTNSSKDLFAYITSSYNTGWMSGSNRIATLSDTDATDTFGDRVVDFGTEYAASGRLTSYSYTDGQNTAVLNDDENNVNGYLSLYITPTFTGRVIIEMVADNAFTPDTGYNNFVRIGIDGITLDTLTPTEQADLTSPKYLEFNAVAGTQYSFNLYSNYDGGDLTYTFNIYKAEDDRSVNKNSLVPYGKLKKTPVAVGADLVSYSNFGGGRYLKWPENDAINGNGSKDWSMTFWIDPENTTGDRSYINYVPKVTTAGNYGWSVSQVGGDLRVYSYNAGNFGNNANDGTIFNDMNTLNGSWHSVTICHVGATGALSFYFDGEKTGSSNGWFFEPSANGELRIGNFFLNASSVVKLSLLRYSVSIPSGEQIKKMYNDEKAMFQDNAKVTLYGTSDAVVALAYDEDNNHLHAGTSDGRSVFQGLCRVDNTTEAVDAAISVSNGMVAED